MKKILALVLAMIMALSMGVAFAESEPEVETENTSKGWTDMKTVTFDKYYATSNVMAVSPEETFEFEEIKFEGIEDQGVGYTMSWAEKNLPTISSVTYSERSANMLTNSNGVVGAKKTFTINLPENYPSVGVYKYTFKEKDNNTLGVTYRSSVITLKVTVVQGKDGLLRVAAVHCEDESGNEKIGYFTNTYSAGTLSVTKEVKGGLGDKNKPFKVTVTFTNTTKKTMKSTIYFTDGDGKTYSIAPSEWKEATDENNNKYYYVDTEIELANGQTAKFTNLPYGISYSVDEYDYTNDSKIDGDRLGYEKAEYDGEQTGTIGAESENVSTKIINTKNGEIDTGMLLDNAPYMIIMALVLVGAAMMLKRRAYND